MLHENQSILITGITGSGKTVTTHRLVHYLSAIAGSHKSDFGTNSIDDKVNSHFVSASVKVVFDLTGLL